MIVLEQAVSLQEYERTGISIDSLVSSQLILNIFEKNTPLHDGAVIMSGNRIRSATCYLPLSDNMTLSKALGTRHRAAVGVSEVSDSLTIVVSEETGSVSVARGGRLLRNLNQEQLKKQLQALQPKTDDSRKIRLWKGRERMKAKIFDNLLFKILALLMAVLLWVVVVNIDDAVSYKKISGVKVNLINTDVLTSQDQTIRVEEGTDIVNLTVYARSSVLKSLKAEDFSATADVKKDLLYDNMVKIGVSYVGSLPSSSIQKIEQDRSNVLVSIEKQVTEQFKVTAKYTGEPSDGLVLGSLVPEQSLVEITGPESVVEKIKQVVAEVDITGITGTAVRSCSLKLQNSDGDAIEGTYLDYVGKNGDFEVTATTLSTKLVGISFDVSQAAPEGYGLLSISYKPETVTIAGEKTALTAISNLEIPAEALNPEGQTGSVQNTVDISQYLPTGIQIPKEDDKSIVVTMEIQELETVDYAFAPAQINYDNLPDGLTVDKDESHTLEIPIRGMQHDLATLSMDAVEVHADLSSYRKAGTYTVPVAVTLPDGFSCPSDLTVDVKLEKAD